MISLTLIFLVLNASNCPVSSPTLVNNAWMTNFTSVDHSHPSKRPVLINHKIVELVDAEHFDWLLQNLRDEERPNSLIVIWNSSDTDCTEAYRSYRIETSTFASRNHLLVGVHDTSPRAIRTWYVQTPEMNLPGRFGVETERSCPEFVFVPRSCNGMTEWCVGEEIQLGVHQIGCDDFNACKDFAIFPKQDASIDLKTWVREKLQDFGVPSKIGKNRGYQARTQTTVTRNTFVPPAVPKFSVEGFQVMKIPQKMYEEMLEFQQKWASRRFCEHEVFGIIQGAKTYMVKLDNDVSFRQRIATEYMQPILEAWTGLELTYESFYGVREYTAGAVLRNHVDRLATHVISATMNVGPLELGSEWPIEVITHNGVRVRYNHPPGTMVLYESTTLIHGRPYPLPASQGSHFGAFIHFSPKPSWDHKTLQENIAKHTTRSLIEDGDLHSLTINADAGYMDNSPSDLPLNVRFYNFGEQDLQQFWVRKENDLVKMGGVESGKYAEVTSYVGHEFAFRHFGSSEIIERRKVKAGRFVEIIAPREACVANSECQQIMEHTGYQDAYFERMGVPYMPPTVRPSTKTFMWPTNYLGQAHSVETEWGFCDDIECLNPMPSNFTLIVVSTSPRVFFIDNLVNDFERKHILATALTRQVRSTVGNGKYGGMKVASRNSKTAWIPHAHDNLLHTVCKRMIRLLNLDEQALQNTEALQVVQYHKGEKYDNHVDFSFEHGNPRFATFGMYLESPEQGGHTGFPRAFGHRGLKVKPKQGGAVLFYSLLEDGNGDANAVHAGMPVKKGVKQFANLWIHEKQLR